MRRTLLTLVVAALLFSPLPARAQIGQTGTLTGTVTDSTGAVLPGATITVTSDALIGGSRTATSDANGTFRFPALPPGRYMVTVEMPSFGKWEREARLELGQTITLDARLEITGVSETVNVSGEAPQVDVTSSASQKNLTTDVMENIPFSSRFGPGAMLLSPGVNPNNYSSYGSGGSSSNSYMIDGVDVSDPEGGTIWVFANHNWIQEVQVIGLGANAEYGGFTGVASNSLFRSGSNMFKGLFETLYENDAMTGENVTDEILAQNEDLTPGKTDYVTDTTFQIGGPIKRDKAWFFTSFQYYRPKAAPAGYPPTPPPGYADTGIGPDARLEHSSRFLFKPTVKIGTSDQLTGFFETDMYRVDGRAIGANVATEAGLHQESPEVAWNANYTKVLNSTSVFDVKYSGFWGYYYLSPYNGDDTPGWYDVDEDFYAVNSYYYYNADRLRHQANASLTKFASGFAGEHNLKFGAEFERSYIKSELGYPGGMYVLASFGEPYYAYLWDGYLKDSINTRLSAYAQDTWALGSRFTLNPGLRFDRNMGYSKGVGDQVFSTNSISPRIGFAWDVTGDSRTVVRGHYGWYFDGAKSSYYDLLDPNNAPFYGAYIDSNLNLISDAYLLTPGGTSHRMDDDIKHPRMKQGLVGIERDLGAGISVGLNGIWRDNDRFIDDVIQTSLSDYETFTLTDPGPDGEPDTGDETGNTVTVYDQITDPADNTFLITNPDSAFRRYRGVELSLNKRMSNRWQMQASWVISKITGNYNNTSSFGNSSEYDSPNTNPELQPYREGRLTNDNTHIAKLLGSYRAPWDVLVSGAFFYTSGQTYSRLVRTPGLTQGRLDMFIEPRGEQRYDDQPRFDLKVEKQFRMLGDRRLGLTFEGFNLFNDAAITSRTTRSGSTYNTPQGLVQARRLRLGAVYRF
jgi:hypothetical protein